jgi:hypothetical protein
MDEVDTLFSQICGHSGLALVEYLPQLDRQQTENLQAM